MNIYVGNLAYSIDDEELRAAFESFGTVDSATVIKDKFSGRSKGFGFVEMTDDEEGQKAVDEMNGKEIGGRPVKVDKARPRERDRNNRGGGENRYW